MNRCCVAECGDRIKPMCNEILPTDSPMLPTVVAIEKMQNPSPFQTIFNICVYTHTQILIQTNSAVFS